MFHVRVLIEVCRDGYLQFVFPAMIRCFHISNNCPNRNQEIKDEGNKIKKKGSDDTSYVLQILLTKT